MTSYLNKMGEWASKLKLFIMPTNKVKDAIAAIKSAGGEIVYHSAHIVDKPIACNEISAIDSIEACTSDFLIKPSSNGFTGYFVTETNRRCNIWYYVYIDFHIKDNSDINKLYQFIETLKQ